MRKDKRLRRVLLAAAACSGLMSAAHAQSDLIPSLNSLTPDTSFEPELGANWGDMSLDDVAQMLGGSLPRPAARPENFESTLTYLPRPRPRPSQLRDADALYLAQAPVEQAPAEPSQPSAELSVVAAPIVIEVTPQAVAETPPQSQPAVLPPTEAAVEPAIEPSVEIAAVAEPTPTAAAAPLPVALDTPEAAPAALPAETTTSEPTAAPPVVVPPLPRLSTAGFSRDTYQRDRAERESRYIAAEGSAKISAAMDLTQLLLSHMLLPEARSFHQQAQALGVQLHPDLHREWRVQAAMLDTLQRHKITEKMPEGWQDASLWAIAGKAAPGQITAEISLTEAIAALQHHSIAITEALLPELFDAALTVGDLRNADTLLRGAREATGLTSEPVYHLMMGRLALAYDMPENAFDYFAKAADGRDIWAQRARIAMADLAIERKDPRLLPALAEILREGVNQWRYGNEGLILRARLAQVAEDLGDIPLALDIMGRISTDHPGTAEAILAHERGALAMAAFAVAVDAGEIGLETYLQSLRHVESFYRLDPIWPIARSALGRAWSRAGLHTAAAAEFAALHNDLQRIGAPTPPEAQRIAISIDEAEAHLLNHDTVRGRIALAREGLPQFSDLANRYSVAALKAGVTAAVTSSGGFTAPDDLRVFAQAARQTGALGAAHSAHRELYLQNTLSAAPAEAIHAALIAHDLQDKDFADRSLRDLRSTPVGAATGVTEPLSLALLTPMPSLVPLSQRLADTMLARTGAALEATNSLLARPLLAPDHLTAWLAERASDTPQPPPRTE